MINFIEKSSISRLKKAIRADAIFEYKQGFYGIYIIITFLYLLLLNQLAAEYVIYVLPFIIFSDPSVLGLFFIGGTILLEKEQGILSSILVTPLRTSEYIFSKLLSLAFISALAALSISLLSYRAYVNYLYLSFGILLSSVFFTLIGILIVTKSRSVNEFFVKMIPYTILLLAPCFLLINYNDIIMLNIFPSVSLFKLVYFSYHGINHIEAIIQISYTTIVNILLFKYTIKRFEERMLYGGNHE